MWASLSKKGEKMMEHILNDPKILRMLDIESSNFLYKVKRREILKTMSNDEVLNKAIQEWVAMSGLEKRVRSALEKGDIEVAKKYIREVINSSGRSGSDISFKKIGSKVEIETIDGRVFYPKETDLINRYLDLNGPENRLF